MSDTAVGEYLIIEAYAALNPEVYTEIYDDRLMKKYVTALIKKTRPAVKAAVIYHIKNSPEYESMTELRGKLRMDLGIENAEVVLYQLIEYIANQISFVKKDGNANSLGGMALYLLKREGLEGLISSPLASYQSKAGEIPWLKWLLTEGSSTIIQDYEVRYYDRPQKNSRSKFALMVQPTKIAARTKSSKFFNSNGNFLGVGGFNIDSEFSGTEDDNWITRSFNRAIPSITDIINREAEQ
jgi:hypothetical protein